MNPEIPMIPKFVIIDIDDKGLQSKFSKYIAPNPEMAMVIITNTPNLEVQDGGVVKTPPELADAVVDLFLEAFELGDFSHVSKGLKQIQGGCNGN